LASLKHVAITVKNLEETIKFYSDFFGFELVKIKSKPELGITYAQLKAGKVSLEIIAPLREASIREEFKNIAAALSRKGLNHLAITVKNLKETCEKFKSQGVSFLFKPKLSGENLKMTFILDPEGNLIELAEES
jgi:lactoylglutathione lyase